MTDRCIEVCRVLLAALKQLADVGECPDCSYMMFNIQQAREAVAEAEQALANSKPALAKSDSTQWRVGSKIPLNVYEGDRSVCQCHFEADAAQIVAAMNSKPAPDVAEPRPSSREVAERVIRASTKAAMQFGGGERDLWRQVDDNLIAGITAALDTAHAQGRAEGLEEAAKIAEAEDESVDSCCHALITHIAAEIRAAIEARGEAQPK